MLIIVIPSSRCLGQLHCTIFAILSRILGCAMNFWFSKKEENYTHKWTHFSFLLFCFRFGGIAESNSSNPSSKYAHKYKIRLILSKLWDSLILMLWCFGFLCIWTSFEHFLSFFGVKNAKFNCKVGENWGKRLGSKALERVILHSHT